MPLLFVVYRQPIYQPITAIVSDRGRCESRPILSVGEGTGSRPGLVLVWFGFGNRLVETSLMLNITRVSPQ